MTDSIVDNNVQFNQELWAVSLLWEKDDVTDSSLCLLIEGENDKGIIAFQLTLSSLFTKEWLLRITQAQINQGQHEKDRKELFYDLMGFNQQWDCKTWLIDSLLIKLHILDGNTKSRGTGTINSLMTTTTEKNTTIPTRGFFSNPTHLFVMKNLMDKLSITLPSSHASFLELVGITVHQGFRAGVSEYQSQ